MVNAFERDQIFATGLRQLLHERHEQGRVAFDRAWRAAEVIRPSVPQPQPSQRSEAA